MVILSLKTSAPEPLPPGAAVSLGFFDGVHAGHRAIISASRRYADEAGVPCAVWMIGDSYKKGSPLLTDGADKLSLLREAGADYAVLSEFKDVCGMSGEEFAAELLKGELAVSAVFCGFNFRFGKGAAWDERDLSRICRGLGIHCRVIPAVTTDGEAVSSSKIRALIATGDVETAAKLLGRPYSVTLPVLEGKRLGRTLGFPTVNQVISAHRVSPAVGVYAAEVVTPDGEIYKGAANIGHCPTVDPGSVSGDGVASVSHAVCETYIVDFSGDLYGKAVEVRFLRRLRGERRFSDIEELKRQIMRDVAEAGTAQNRKDSI